MKTELSIVHSENYLIRRDVTDRGKRIDALTVDRSRFAGMPLARWSAEAEARELPLQSARAELTEADRIRARRALFALTSARLVQKRSA